MLLLQNVMLPYPLGVRGLNIDLESKLVKEYHLDNTSDTTCTKVSNTKQLHVHNYVYMYCTKQKPSTCKAMANGRMRSNMYMYS